MAALAGVRPVRMKDTNTGRMVDDYWDASKKMLMEFDFLDSLKKYDKDHIPPEVIQKIRPFVHDPDFQPKVIEKVTDGQRGKFVYVCVIGCVSLGA